MRIPTELIPVCPDDGSEVTLNLRSDDTFVEDEGWHRASARYADFLRRHEGLHVLYLELGVGGNTPVLCTASTGNTIIHTKQQSTEILLLNHQFNNHVSERRAA